MPMSRQYVLAIDQGTTSTRAIVFDRDGRSVGSGAEGASRSTSRKPGWVEHDPEEIWRDTLAVCRQALAAAGLGADDIAAIGITNQRETTVLWERGDRQAGPSAPSSGRTGAPRRSAAELAADGLEDRGPGAHRPRRSTPTSPAPSSPGCSTTCRARARAPSAASSPSARSTASCCGA